MANPKTTRIAIKRDPLHGRPNHECYDIYRSRRFLWFFWAPFYKTGLYVWGKCRGDAWNKAYERIYGTDFYYGPTDKKELING